MMQSLQIRKRPESPMRHQGAGAFGITRASLIMNAFVGAGFDRVALTGQVIRAVGLSPVSFEDIADRTGTLVRNLDLSRRKIKVHSQLIPSHWIDSKTRKRINSKTRKPIGCYCGLHIAVTLCKSDFVKGPWAEGPMHAVA